MNEYKDGHVRTSMSRLRTASIKARQLKDRMLNRESTCSSITVVISDAHQLPTLDLL